jgi:ribonuclease D
MARRVFLVAKAATILPLGDAMPSKPPDVTPEIVRDDLTQEQLEALLFSPEVALDTETLGLKHLRDRLCLVQLCDRKGRVVLVQFSASSLQGGAPRLRRLLEEPDIVKVLHFARFDLAALRHHLGIRVAPIYCTRTASKIARTYTDRHGLKDLLLELFGIEIDKTTRHTDWSSPELTIEQVRYAAADVTLLLPLMDRLNSMLERQGRDELARECFAVIPTLASLDLAGYDDVFIH